MKSLIRVITPMFILVLLTSMQVWSGQNENAAIRIDFDYETVGNQDQNSISPPGTGVTVWLEIHVVGASNLDSYEFNLNFSSSDLTYKAAYADNFHSGEDNILKKHGAGIVGPIINTDTPGVLNFSLVNDTNDPALCPEGDGLLALVKFETKVDAPGKLTFGDVIWLDNNGVRDDCTDEGDASLPVELSLFEAEPGDGQVLLKWTTESEVNSLGFNLYRASQDDSSNYAKINGQMIRSAGNSTSQRHYTYLDNMVENEITYNYKLESVDIDGSCSHIGSISTTPQMDRRIGIPKTFDLAQNFPNPFNPQTTIEYDLPEATHVEISIYNLVGEEIRKLIDQDKQSGCYSIVWNGQDDQGNALGSGVYIIRMTAGNFVQSQKITLVR